MKKKKKYRLIDNWLIDILVNNWFIDFITWPVRPRALLLETLDKNSLVRAVGDGVSWTGKSRTAASLAGRKKR